MGTDKHVIESTPALVPRFAIVVMVALVVSIISLVLVQTLIRPNNGVQDGVGGAAQATQEFIPGQAMTVNVDTITVYVPPDAINVSGSIFITARERDLFPFASQPEWTRPLVVDVEFRNAEGTPVPNTLFSAPVQICFQLTAQQWDDFVQQPGLYEVQYYAAKKNPPVWEKLPMTTKAELSLLCGETYHLSLFALAIKSEIGIPVTGPTATLVPTPTSTRRPTREPRPADEEPAPTDRPQPTQPPATEPPTEPPPTDPPTEPPTELPTEAPTEPPVGGILPTLLPILPPIGP